MQASCRGSKTCKWQPGSAATQAAQLHPTACSNMHIARGTEVLCASAMHTSIHASLSKGAVTGAGTCPSCPW